MQRVFHPPKRQSKKASKLKITKTRLATIFISLPPDPQLTRLKSLKGRNFPCPQNACKKSFPPPVLHPAGNPNSSLPEDWFQLMAKLSLNLARKPILNTTISVSTANFSVARSDMFIC